MVEVVEVSLEGWEGAGQAENLKGRNGILMRSK